MRGSYFKDNGSTSGNGVYLTSVWEHAKKWSNFTENGDEKGEVVRFALEKDAKIVSLNYLSKLFIHMAQNYANYFKDFLSFSNEMKSLGGPILAVGCSAFKKEAEFVKNKTGFDFFNKTDGFNGNRFEEYGKRLNSVLYGVDGKTVNENVFKEYVDLIKPVSENCYIVNKQVALSQNFGLLAKLLGFDCVFEPGFPFFEGELSDENFVTDEFCVVNLNKLSVCADEFRGSPNEQDVEQPVDVENELEIYEGDVESDCDKLFVEVKKFLDDSKNVSESEFDNYCRNFIKEKTSAYGTSDILSLKSPDFEDRKSRGGYLQCYRGIGNKVFAENTRAGEVFLGGFLTGVFNVNGKHDAEYGSGIYLTSNYEYAKYFAGYVDEKTDLSNKSDDKKFSRGEVIKFLLAKDSRIIKSEYLAKVFSRMLEKYGQECDSFKEYLALEKFFPQNKICWSNSFRLESGYLKEKLGFDFFADLTAKSPENRYKNYLEIKNGLQNGENVARMQNFLTFLQSRKIELENDFLINKVYYLKQNLGLLALLLGFDGVYGEPWRFKKLDVCKADDLVIVNFNKIVVCGDCFKEVALRRRELCGDSYQVATNKGSKYSIKK